MPGRAATGNRTPEESRRVSFNMRGQAAERSPETDPEESMQQSVLQQERLDWE